MEKEKIIIEIMEIEDLMKIVQDKNELRSLRIRYNKLNKKLTELK